MISLGGQAPHVLRAHTGRMCGEPNEIELTPAHGLCYRSLPGTTRSSSSTSLGTWHTQKSDDTNLDAGTFFGCFSFFFIVFFIGFFIAFSSCAMFPHGGASCVRTSSRDRIDCRSHRTCRQGNGRNRSRISKLTATHRVWDAQDRHISVRYTLFYTGTRGSTRPRMVQIDVRKLKNPKLTAGHGLWNGPCQLARCE